MELCPSASGHARKRAALGRELGGVSLRFSVRREESGWCLQQIKETRIIKRPQSPFIFLLFLPVTSFIGDAVSACSFPPAGAGCARPGWGSSLCCWSGCDIARCGDNCASYCLASAGDDQLQTKTMTMGIPFVFPGLDAAEVAAVLFLSSSPLLLPSRGRWDVRGLTLSAGCCCFCSPGEKPLVSRCLEGTLIWSEEQVSAFFPVLTPSYSHGTAGRWIFYFLKTEWWLTCIFCVLSMQNLYVWS